MLDGIEKSVKGAMKELVKFTYLSGLKVNIDKTSCLPIGTLITDNISRNLGIKIVEELRILGAAKSNNGKNATSLQ